jgi:hypothetical protein
MSELRLPDVDEVQQEEPIHVLTSERTVVCADLAFKVD